MEHTKLQTIFNISITILLSISLILAILNLIGWSIHNITLMGFKEAYIPMAPNTALCFILLSIALYSFMNAKWIRIARLLLGIVFIIIIARFIEFTGINLNVDRWIFSFPATHPAPFLLHMMSIPTHIAFLFLALSIFFARSKRPFFAQTLVAVLSAIPLLIGIAFLFGYVYQNPLLYGSPAIPMALNTAISFVSLSAATFILGIGRDIVQRAKDVQALREADQLKQQHIEKMKELEQSKNMFLSMISHELRTPLTPIRSHLELLSNKKLSTKQSKESIEIILRNVIRLNGLINDLLDATRIQSGQLRITKAKTDLKKVITDAIEVVTPYASEKNIIITKNIEQLPMISADKDRITQVIINIMNNAIKHSETKRIILSAHRKDGSILINIRDEGKGMQKEDIERLFTPFFITQRKDPTQGAGLGLYICKAIIDLHAGTIWAESTLGKGTAFSFTLPEVNT